MSTTYEIPLSAESQTFKIDLAGVTYQIYLWWNVISSNWNIDISDEDGNSILDSIPLVADVNLLEQYGYLNFGGELIAQTDNEEFTNPTFDNIGSTGHLYFVVT